MAEYGIASSAENCGLIRIPRKKLNISLIILINRIRWDSLILKPFMQQMVLTRGSVLGWKKKLKLRHYKTKCFAK
jgi:hypothetical protein